MTEKTSPQAPEIAVPRIEGAPKGLQLDTLDSLVDYRREIERRFKNQDQVTDKETFTEQQLDILLGEYGIADDENDTKAHEDYLLAKNIYRDVINMSEDEWLTTEEDKEVQRRNVAYRAVADHFDTIDSPDTTPPGGTKTGGPAERSELTYAEKDQAVEMYSAALDKYAKLVAERSKRMIERAHTREDIDSTKGELSDMLGALATAMMDELIEEKKTGGEVTQEIVDEIDAFIATQTDEVLQKMEAHRMAEYNDARPLMKKFYDKWASWGQEKGLMTKGNLKKAAVFAVPGAALGAVLVPVAGVVGFGAVTGTLAVAGARSVGRRLAGAKLDAVANSGRVAEQQSADIRSRIKAENERELTDVDRPERDENGNVVSEGKNLDILEIIDGRTEAYRKRNLRRTAGGLAIAMTVGLLTAKGADILADNVDNLWFGKLGDIGGKPEIDSDGPDNLPDRDGDGIPDRLNKDRDGDGVLNGNDPAPNNPNIPDGNGGNDTLTRDEMFDGYQGTREFTAEGQKDFNEWISKKDGYQVKPGDSVWKLSEQYLNANGNPNPTTYEIDAVKDSVLKEFKVKGLVDSRGWLSVGDTIKIK